MQDILLYVEFVQLFVELTLVEFRYNILKSNTDFHTKTQIETIVSMAVIHTVSRVSLCTYEHCSFTDCICHFQKNL